MTKSKLTILLALLMSMVTSVASAHDFEVDGIYYVITSSADHTVAVSYRGSDFYSYSDEYTGKVTIPETVTYNGIVTEVRPVQSRNAPMPMLVTLSGITIEVRPVQSQNAYMPMLVTPLPKSMEVRPQQ